MKAARILLCSIAAWTVTAGAQDLTLDDLRGDWLGIIEMAPGTYIRQVIQIIDKADGTIGANLASIDQGSLYLPVTAVDLDGNHFTLTVGSLGITIDGRVSDQATIIDARISQGNASDPVVFARVADIDRDDPVQSEYASEDVRFHNAADQVWLAGTLVRPRGSRAVPAIVFVSGSGTVQRDYSVSLAIADGLARQGYAVLRYDKRGVFQSTGRYSEADESAFARDATAAWQYLAARDDVDSTRVGFIGHSEGSQVAAQAIADYGADPAFVVSMAGVGLSALETTILQDGTERAAAGATPREVAVLREFSRRFYAAAMDPAANQDTRLATLRALYDDLDGSDRETILEWNGAYGRNTNTISPRTASTDLFVARMRLPAPTVFWRDIDVPVLVLNGGADAQVPAAEHMDPILQALTHPASLGHVFPGLDHEFRDGGAISPAVVPYIASWLAAQQFAPD